MVVLAENVEWVGERGRVQSNDGAAREEDLLYPCSMIDTLLVSFMCFVFKIELPRRRSNIRFTELICCPSRTKHGFRYPISVLLHKQRY